MKIPRDRFISFSQSSTIRYTSFAVETRSWSRAHNMQHYNWAIYVHINSVNPLYKALMKAHYNHTYGCDVMQEVSNIIKNLHNGCTFFERTDDGFVVGCDFNSNTDDKSNRTSLIPPVEVAETVANLICFMCESNTYNEILCRRFTPLCQP